MKSNRIRTTANEGFLGVQTWRRGAGATRPSRALGCRTTWSWPRFGSLLCSAVLIGFACLPVSVAFAQGSGPQKGAALDSGSDENVEYKDKTVYDFDDDIVEGDLQRPDGELVGALNNTQHDSLIEIRRDFIPEMLKTLEDI